MDLKLQMINKYIYFIFLFFKTYIPYPITVELVCNIDKKREKKEKTKKKQIRAEGETIHPKPGN